MNATTEAQFVTAEITALLERHGVLADYVEWQSYTPNWRNQIAAHHFGSRQDQGPESLRGYFRQVRNYITTDVSVWPNVALNCREQTNGKVWVTKSEWDALPKDQRLGRSSKNPCTSKACVLIFANGTQTSVPVYVIEASGHLYT